VDVKQGRGKVNPHILATSNSLAKPRLARVVGQFDKEASQTRDYCVAENSSVAFALSGQAATKRAARPDPSLRKKRWFRMTGKLTHYPGKLFGMIVLAGIVPRESVVPSESVARLQNLR
jgi:hypothetical protein